MPAGASQMHPGWRVTDHSAPGDRLLANVLWGSSGSTVLVKDKQGSVCSILGVWVAVNILNLPIPGQPDLATSLEWKALSLSWLMTLPGCHLPGTFCGLVLLSRRYSAKTNLSGARAASRTGENRCWQRLWATSSCP